MFTLVQIAIYIDNLLSTVNREVKRERDIFPFGTFASAHLDVFGLRTSSPDQFDHDGLKVLILMTKNLKM